MRKNVISVGLARKLYGYTADEIGALEILNFNNQGIEEIDNLEVFSQIKELHLSGNAIKVIENLEYLSSLEFLDLSNNMINSHGLKNCFGRLPKSLQTVNLSGNACSLDESLLMELQDMMPNLGIVVGLEQDDGVASSQTLETSSIKAAADFGTNEGEEDDGHRDSDDEDEDDDDSENDEDAQMIAAGPLNADDVLEALVSRKCKLQNASSDFSLEDTLKILQNESESAISNIRRRQSSIIATSGAVDVEQRVGEMMARHQAALAESQIFMKSFLEAARIKRDSAYAEASKDTGRK